MKINIILSTLLIPFFVFSQEITFISPNQGEQGQSLDVTISGSNINFDDYSNGSSLQFVFSGNYSDSYSFYGNIYYSSSNYAYANVNIPLQALPGNYDVKVYNFNNNSWVTAPDMFSVTSLPPELLGISPSTGVQGQSLSVNISTFNVGLEDFSETTSSFRIIQPSTNSILTINNTSLSEANFSTPSSLQFTFSATGDLGSSHEYWEVFDENGSFLSNVGVSGEDCNDQYYTSYYTANQYQIEQWFIDGVLSFECLPTSSVNICSSNNINISFSYNGINYQETLSFGSNPYPSSIDFIIDPVTWTSLSLSGVIDIPNDQSTGLYDLEVYDFNTNSWIWAPSMFNILPPPSVNYISPNNAEQGQYLSVNINTSNMQLDDWSSSTSQFRFSQSGENIFYGNSNYHSGNTLYGNINISSNQDTGIYDLEVYNYNTNSWVIAQDMFSITEPPPPSVNYISPNNAEQGQYLSVNINTSNIMEGAWSSTTSQFRFSQSGENIFYGNSSYHNGNTLYGNISVPSNQDTGTYDLEVYNYNTNSWVIAQDMFSITEPPPPSVNYISPNNAEQGQYLSININTTNFGLYINGSISQFRFSQSGENIFYGNSNYHSGNTLYGEINIPYNQPLGVYDLEVYNYNTSSWMIIQDKFTVTDPTTATLNWISPNQAEQGDYLDVTISGSNIDFENYSDNYSSLQFIYSDYSESYSFSGNIYSSDNNYAYANVNVPSQAYTGNYDIQVYNFNTNNYVILENGFVITQAQDSASINWVSPSQAEQGQSLDVTISGYNIDFENYSDNYSSLQFIYSDYSESYSFSGNIYSSENNDAYAIVNVPLSAYIGNYDIQVYDFNTNNFVVLENGFYVEEPPMSINSISPNNAIQGEYLSVTISGSNFNNTSSNIYFIYSDYTESNPYFDGDNDSFNGWINYIGDSEIFGDVFIPDETLPGYYDVQILDYETGDWTILENGFYVSQASPCDNWEIYSNDIFEVPFLSDDEDIAYVCNGSVLEVQGAWHNSFSSENLYWSNGQPISSSLVIENDINASIVFISEDTTCIVETMQINVIQDIEEIADITTVLNSCYGVQDGSIEIEGLPQVEGQSLVFSAQQELIPFLSQFDYEDNLLQESLQIANPNEVSQVFVAWEYGSDGCIFDVDFNTEIETPESYNLPFTELFDSGMPCDWLNSSKWTFGQTNELSGLYWDIPEHNMFAVSNDDLCNCDMMEDKLITPPINLGNETGNLILTFAAYFNGYYGSQSQIDISTNNGETWNSIASLSSSDQWQVLEFDISQFLGNDQIQISFTHSDGHSWGSGFAIDDVAVFFQCADDDNDGVCNDDEMFGCTDTLANNYNELATEDDGSCQIDIYGCTYPIAINYNPEANIDDGSCYFTLEGCTDELATNYNPEATSDDGSCEYIISEDPCAIVPSGLFVDNIIHNRIVFNWSAPSAAPSHYMIRYRAVGSSSWTVMTAGPVNSNEYTGTSRTRYFMEPGTTYEWSMRARVLNEDGTTNCQSSWSSNSEYTTLPACANLENLSVSTEANWVTLMADAPAVDWGVWQSKGKMRELGTNSYRYVNGDSQGAINFLKGNFDPSTEYEWHTKAWCTGNVDANGDSDPMYHSGWGDFSAFSTEAPCDAVPLNLSTSSNGANTSITMTWDTPESGAPDHYFLELTNETSGQVWAWNNIAGNSNSKTKYGLTTGDDYSWRIRGACGTNGTSWATSFTAPVYYTLGGERLAGPVANLDVYPNPSRDIFNVTFESAKAQTMTVRVVNMIGEEVYTEELIEFVGSYNKVIDMNTQPKGVYFLEITTTYRRVKKKVVLQ